MNEFKVQVGNPQKSGFLSTPDRLKTLAKGGNPFISQHSLPGNSGVFFGRAKELYRIIAAARNPDKPISFSLIGEQGIGKSSLLNQVFQSLAKEPEIISVQISVQNWGQYNAANFFKQLHYSIASALRLSIEENEGSSYLNFLNFITYLNKNSDYRFILLIDEFEKMAGNLNFNPSFFSHLRELADTPDYRLAFVVSSCRELKKLCLAQKLDDSGFWNIFTNHETLGLLTEQDAKDLLLSPLAQTQDCLFKNSAKLWLQVKVLTGCHPLLIQLAAAEFWNANDGHFKPNVIELKMNLRSFMEELFYQRSLENQQHWQMLIQAAGGKKIKETSVFYDLYLRGLALEHGEPFSQYFAKVITEECEEKLNRPFEEILDQTTLGLGKKDEIVNQLWLEFLGNSKSVGKLKEQFSNGSDNAENLNDEYDFFKQARPK